MTQPLFNPFEKIIFDQNICFLTGQPLEEGSDHFIEVFPQWLLDRYQLDNATIMLLDLIRVKYKDMKLPASPEVIEAVKKLDEVTQLAFETGFEAVRALPQLTIFQWMARVLYGVLYQDFDYARNQYILMNKPFQISAHMQKKLRNLLFMLQSLVRPIAFEGFTPWSMVMYRVHLSKDVLNYKDETKDLNFCLNMNGFGIICSMQDNGEVKKYQQEILDKIGGATLHPAQFEELYGRFLYTNFLLKAMPDYIIKQDGDTITFKLPEIPEEVAANKFNEWKDDIFAQVLTNMWQPWGIPLDKVHHYPYPPISFLIDDATYELVDFDRVPLPY